MDKYCYYKKDIVPEATYKLVTSGSPKVTNI
jgi:hypothetical protein